MKLKWTYNRKSKNYTAEGQRIREYTIYKSSSRYWIFTLIQTGFKRLDSAKKVAQLIEGG